VVRNLVENAVAYADAGDQVVLATAPVADGLCVRVRNTGSQVSQAEAEAATQRFWRGDQARSVGDHCGLGLALVERSLQALGGTLRLTSERGGEFQAEVVLPLPA